MTTATKLTPVQFLATNPDDHPDFVLCDDPQCGEVNKTGRKDQTLFMPNLDDLIRRIGGPDAIPDQYELGFRDIFPSDDPRSTAQEREDDFQGYCALLKDLHSGLIYARLSRTDDGIFVDRWHPKQGFLEVLLAAPTDWSVSAWSLPCVMIMDVFSASYDLDRLIAESLDYWLGSIQKATATYLHVRRDVLIF